MTKREKIMLAVGGVLALGYGLLTLQDLLGAKAPEIPRLTAQDVLGRTSNLTSGESLAKRQLYALETSLQPITADHFRGDFSLGDKLAQGSNIQALAMQYSGYLIVGKRPYAIIDGLEYTIGDQIASTGYSIKEITQEFVLLDSGEDSPEQKIKYIGDPL